MSTSTSSTLLHLPITIPQPLQNTNTYTIQLSVRNTEANDMEVFLEDTLKPADLGMGNTVAVERDGLPRFKGDGGREVRAYYWVRGRVVGMEVLGMV